MSARCNEDWQTCDRSYCQRERECAERAASAPATRAAPAAFEAALSDEQRHERALFETRMRSNKLRALPTCFSEFA